MKDLIFFALYLIIISAISVAATVFDKASARKNRIRIPESVLFLIAGFGGAFAMLITMNIIRHKTRHKRFMLGLPVIILIQLFISIFLFTLML